MCKPKIYLLEGLILIVGKVAKPDHHHQRIFECTSICDQSGKSMLKVIIAYTVFPLLYGYYLLRMDSKNGDDKASEQH